MGVNSVTEVVSNTPGCLVDLKHSLDGNEYAQQVRNNIHKTVPEWIMQERGTPPTQRVVARHTCGHRWCVNPDHIVAGTRRENFLDDVDHKGEKHPRHKLTAEQVRLIRKSLMSDYSLGRKFGVSPRTINDARRRRTWVSLI